MSIRIYFTPGKIVAVSLLTLFFLGLLLSGSFKTDQKTPGVFSSIIRQWPLVLLYVSELLSIVNQRFSGILKSFWLLINRAADRVKSRLK